MRGGWFAKRKSCTGVEGLEVAKLPGQALLISRSTEEKCIKEKCINYL